MTDVIFLDPNFTTISVQIMIVKEISFLEVYVVSISGKHGLTVQRPFLSTESFRDAESDSGRFVMKNNTI